MSETDPPPPDHPTERPPTVAEMLLKEAGRALKSSAGKAAVRALEGAAVSLAEDADGALTFADRLLDLAKKKIDDLKKGR